MPYDSPTLDAAETMGLTLPVSLTEFKRAYRSAVKSLHPDNKRTGDSEAFIKIQQAYELLSVTPEAFEGAPPSSIMTADGTPLSELGKGLGPTTNGRICPDCEGNGYETLEGFGSWKVCENCIGGRVPRVYPCRPCKGTGKFTQEKSGRVVDCRVCKGTGLFRHPRITMNCPVCDGTATVKTPGNVVYNICWRCKGAGEVKIFNPVIPKGALTK